MIISSSLGFIFVHIHKTGGSSMEVALDPFLAWNDILLGSTAFGEIVNEAYNTRHSLHKHSSMMDIQRVVGKSFADKAYKFTLVREPISRICSLYNFLGSIVNGISKSLELSSADLLANIDALKPAHPQLSWYSAQAFLAKSFSDFIRDPILLEYDVAFRSQVSMISTNGSIGVDNFYRLEEVKEATHLIGQRLGIELDLPHNNMSAQRLVRVDSLERKDLMYLRELYKDDFSLFGY